MKRAYITLLTTNDYLKGVLVLRESLLRVGARYCLVAIITENVSPEIDGILVKFNIEPRRVSRNIDVPESMKVFNEEHGLSHFNNTFGKFHIFNLLDYDKLVYLDSDMILLNNVDILFDSPHMSAVVAGKNFPGNDHWNELNAGLMVVVPEPGLLDKLIATIPEAARQRRNQADQSVLHVFYNDWPNKKELELDERYNIFHCYIDYYVKENGYSLNGSGKRISIVHFITRSKPWMKSYLQQLGHLFSLLRQRKMNELKVYIIYMAFLVKVDFKIFGMQGFGHSKSLKI
jgi:glycogenin glucosyltransferase